MLTSRMLAWRSPPNSGRDSQVLAGLLEQMDDPIGHVRGDGAYARMRPTAAGAGRRSAPRTNAVPQAPIIPQAPSLPLAADGLPAWKRAVGYHRRSLAENAMYRCQAVARWSSGLAPFRNPSPPGACPGGRLECHDLPRHARFRPPSLLYLEKQRKKFAFILVMHQLAVCLSFP